MGLINLIFPKHCPLCDEIIEPFAKICEECDIKSYQFLDKSIDDYFHFSFDDIISVYEYKDVVRDGIKRFKFNSLRENGKFFASKMAEIIKLHYEQDFDLIVAVPMTLKSKKLRGYNQAEVLAQYLAKELKMPFVNDVLIKTKTNQIQHKLDKSKRRQNVKGVFEVSKTTDIKDKNILLVDDIITTGSTLDECSRVLKSAGANKVYCATIAKTMLDNC